MHMHQLREGHSHFLLFLAIYPEREACLAMKRNYNLDHTKQNTASTIVPSFPFPLQNVLSTVHVRLQLCEGQLLHKQKSVFTVSQRVLQHQLMRRWRCRFVFLFLVELGTK